MPSNDLSEVAEAALRAAKKAGADAADALVIEGTSISVDVRAGALEKAERAEGIDVGLRVLVGRRQACISASDRSVKTLSEIAERAVAMAREAPEDPYVGLAETSDLSPVRSATDLELADDGPEPEPGHLEAVARTAEDAALGHGSISQVELASAGYGKWNMHLAATNGFSGGYRRTSQSRSCIAIIGSGTGMDKDYDFDSRIFGGDLRSAEDIGNKAAERALARAGARKPPTGAFPVVYDERIAAGLLGHLLQAASGTSVARGASWLRDSMNTSVMPKGMEVTEEPHRPRVGGSRPFDAEGLRTGRRDIVKDGVLLGWTLDLSTARQLGLSPTANAARGTASPPAPSLSNITMTQGDGSRADLLADMGTGLLITSLIGASINPTTGDYSRGASGFWVEGGEIQYPVNECTIGGNLLEMMGRLTPANDARAHLSRVVPSLLVEGLTIGGE
ncbi:MAG: TldD/PmbA family protein [Pseudomonadota bacterium]